jgi:transcriptional regulator with XRE-family HTH domain
MATDTGAAPRTNGPAALAALLRAWRQRELLTQQQLAERSGLGVRTIGRLESGGQRRPRGESVRLLADALNLTEPDRARFTAAARREPVEHLPALAMTEAGTVPIRPSQLPADVAGFTGRSQDLERLDALLAEGAGATAVVISAIAGTAGAGSPGWSPATAPSGSAWTC